MDPVFLALVILNQGLSQFCFFDNAPNGHTSLAAGGRVQPHMVTQPEHGHPRSAVPSALSAGDAAAPVLEPEGQVQLHRPLAEQPAGALQRSW